MTPLFLFALLAPLVARLPISSASSGDFVAETRATPDATAALSFAASKWIWTPTTTPNAFVALRKGFTPPLGKALIAAEIMITAASQLELFVNGDYIGSGTPPNRGRFANRFCVDLLPSFNVFAVNASVAAVTGSNGGLLATILLTYTDGTTDTLVTDSSWRVHSGLPLGFEQLSFDDMTWSVATVAGAYGAAPWGDVNIPSNPPVVGLTRAQWVWTDVVPASRNLPAGARAFRRIFTPAPGQVAMSASILIAADNVYTLYVNGVEVGTGSNWKVAQHYIVNFAQMTPGAEVVFAVLATNNAVSPAGVIFSAEINMLPSGRANCTAGSFVLTDATWKSTKGAIPNGFEQPEFDDSAWPAVVAEETYPGPATGATWGTITVAGASPPVTV